jgi:hypothetical protein
MPKMGIANKILLSVSHFASPLNLVEYIPNHPHTRAQPLG